MLLVLKTLKPVQQSVQLHGVLLGCLEQHLGEVLYCMKCHQQLPLTNEEQVGGVEGGPNTGEWCPCHAHFTERDIEAQTQEAGSHACLLRLRSQDFSRGVCCTAKF